MCRANKPKQFQFRRGVNEKVLTGTITDIFFTTRGEKTFKWLKIGAGDTLIHVWPKEAKPS